MRIFISRGKPSEVHCAAPGPAWGMHVMAEAGVPKEDLKRAASQLFVMSQAPT